MKVSMKDVLRELQRRGDVRFGDENPVMEWAKAIENYTKKSDKIFNECKSKSDALLRTIPSNVLNKSKGYKAVKKYENDWKPLNIQNRLNTLKKLVEQSKQEQSARMSFSTDSDEWTKVFEELAKVYRKNELATQKLNRTTLEKIREIRGRLPKWLTSGIDFYILSPKFNTCEEQEKDLFWIVNNFKNDAGDARFGNFK